MFWKIAHFLANRWDKFHMFLWDQIHINRVGPGTFLHLQRSMQAITNRNKIQLLYLFQFLANVIKMDFINYDNNHDFKELFTWAWTVLEYSNIAFPSSILPLVIFQWFFSFKTWMWTISTCWLSKFSFAKGSRRSS